MVSVSCLVAVNGGVLESLTWNVRGVAEAGAVGVPLSSPLGARVSPVGKVPDVSVNVYGCVPPPAVRVWEYEVPTVPSGNDAVEIASCPVTVMLTTASGMFVPTALICAVPAPIA
jgi:hypothetical protein